MILRGDDACNETGIPTLHAEAFQEVADRTDAVIMSRAVGKYATGLILESYSSKGFHNKAKSCNWGPMAGFVLDDPRFTKVGGTDKGVAEQLEALGHAIHDAAVEVPLFISEARRRWLVAENLIKFADRDSDSYIVKAVSPWGLALTFRLKRGRPEGAKETMWAVQYLKADRQSARGASGGADGQWTPVMAMRDPLCAIAAANYRAATTGDYDLFAIWVKSASYAPDTADRRMVSHAHLEANIKAKLKDTGEDAHLGNVTPRLLDIRSRLNTGFVRRGYTGGNMVHHSDEGGRPFVKDIDLPIFAVKPGEARCYALTVFEDLRQFVTGELDRAYAPIFHPGWMRQLVFSARQANGKERDGADLKKQLMAKALKFNTTGSMR